MPPIQLVLQAALLLLLLPPGADVCTKIILATGLLYESMDSQLYANICMMDSVCMLLASKVCIYTLRARTLVLD